MLDAELPPLTFTDRLSKAPFSAGSVTEEGGETGSVALPHLRRLRVPEIPLRTLEVLWQSGRLSSFHELGFKLPRIHLPTTTSYVDMLAACPSLRNAVLTADHAVEINEKFQATGYATNSRVV